MSEIKATEAPVAKVVNAYYSKSEVAEHNVQFDCWVSYFGKVYDLTPLLTQNKGSLAAPILKFAGQDITHWFDPRSRNPRTHVHPATGVQQFFCPYGRFIHIPPAQPSSEWSTDFGTPWWKDEQYWVGLLSQSKRKIRIVNQLTSQEDVLEVCSEESLEAIRGRYLKCNKHAHSYTWKRLGRVLDMTLNLEDNQIPNQAEEFAKLGIEEDEYIPSIHVYFDDNLTIA
jgi:hypothetical protein